MERSFVLIPNVICKFELYKLNCKSKWIRIQDWVRINDEIFQEYVEAILFAFCLEITTQGKSNHFLKNYVLESKTLK